MLQIFLTISVPKSGMGHDGCKNEMIGSYEVTCNGGERICHNTVLNVVEKVVNYSKR